jgi:hypothetical protein
MRTLSHLTVAVALTAFGVSPALGQSAPLKDEQQKRVEAERRAAEERAVYARQVQAAQERVKVELEAKARELEKLRDQLSEEVRRRTERPSQPAIGVRSIVTQPVPAADPLAALKPLLRSEDPKVAALAAQLTELLAKKAPLRVELSTLQSPLRRIDEQVRLPIKVGGAPTSEPLKVVVFDRDVKTTKTVEAGSSLRMSADGKSAAVVAADGTVTVYDTASGKELMRFPVKK